MLIEVVPIFGQVAARLPLSGPGRGEELYGPGPWCGDRRNPTAVDQKGETAAAVELRRLFPESADNTEAQLWVRVIAGLAAAVCAAVTMRLFIARERHRCGRQRLRARGRPAP